MTKTNEGQRAKGTGHREGEGQGTEVKGQAVDALLLELGHALDVRPSADFGTKVMTRLERATPSLSMWSWRWGFAAGALVTVVALTVLSRVNASRPDTLAHDVHATSNVSSPTAVPQSPTPSATVFVRQRLPQRARTSATRGAQHDPQVLIAPDQAAAVRHLLDRFARGDVPSTSLIGTGDEPAPLEIDELAPIPLIVITPLAVPSNAGGAGSRK